MLRNKLFGILLVLSSCTEETPKQEPVDWSTEKSTDMNKEFAFQEDMRIKMFLEDKPSWKTKKTGTGLRYFIYEEGKGEQAQSEMTAEVKYKISLLNGNLCYETEKDETESFKIDKSDVESGVNEGIKKMKIGDKAKLIVPSHLAHGLVGDYDKIPPLQALIIDIELISLKK
ncbi:MAG: FKBP-type peptidyl-prolyl cis-trans isomerase [Flavobacteriia bacterium]|jgi:FKBP-type peptidyl-prolyl cis-trans isomerase